MKRQDFIKIVKLAKNQTVDAPALFSQEMEVFHGCALDKTRRMVSTRQMIGLIRENCCTFGGDWLDSELPFLAELSKRFDLVD